MTDGRIVSPFWAFEGKERKRRGERGGEGRDKEAAQEHKQAWYRAWQVQVQIVARRTCKNANMTQMMVWNSSQILDVVPFLEVMKCPSLAFCKK